MVHAYYAMLGGAGIFLESYFRATPHSLIRSGEGASLIAFSLLQLWDLLSNSFAFISLFLGRGERIKGTMHVFSVHARAAKMSWPG